MRNNPVYGQDWAQQISGYGQLGAGPAAASTSQVMGMPDYSGNVTSGLPDIALGDDRNGLFKSFGMDEGRLALGGLQTIGQLWGAIQSAKMAKKTFNFNKEMGEANYAQQLNVYREALDGRRRTREVVEGQTPEQSQAYYDRFKGVDRPQKGG